MKNYKKLPIPKTSAWDRKTWRRYLPIPIKLFIQGVHNILRWIPTLYRDKDWDDYYITKLLQKKIEHQREHLVQQNRHTLIDYDNFWMTVVLNLIEREHEEYYNLEIYDHYQTDIKFVPVPDGEGYTLEQTYVSGDINNYVEKYKGVAKRIMKLYPEVSFINPEVLARYIGSYNQKRCRDLIFEILKRKSAGWWD